MSVWTQTAFSDVFNVRTCVRVYSVGIIFFIQGEIFQAAGLSMKFFVLLIFAKRGNVDFQIKNSRYRGWPLQHLSHVAGRDAE